jgi:hypothetical protein
MAQQTQHLVQSFTAGHGGSLKADKPMACKTADEAKRKAERMADSKVGVVAFGWLLWVQQRWWYRLTHRG